MGVVSLRGHPLSPPSHGFVVLREAVCKGHAREILIKSTRVRRLGRERRAGHPSCLPRAFSNRPASRADTKRARTTDLAVVSRAHSETEAQCAQDMESFGTVRQCRARAASRDANVGYELNAAIGGSAC